MNLLPLDRNNNFDLIRLAAALQVALMHSSEHLKAPLPIADFLRHFPGVSIFFYISGMMVTASVCRRSLGDYAEARFRRIYPALLLAFLMTVVILIAFGQIGLGELRDPVFWAWVASQLTLFQVFNPDMFRDFGVGVVNGSLWTIPVEVGFYLILPVLFFFAKGSRTAASLLFAIGAVITFPIGYLLQPLPETPILKLMAFSPLAHFWLFALGGLTYLHWDRIKPLVARVHWLAPLAAYVAFVSIFDTSGMIGAAIGAVMLCATVLSLGMGAPAVAGLLRGYDISYGLYLYHMLAINTLLVLGVTGWTGTILDLTVAITVAALSWHFIESPILRRKTSRPAMATV